MTRPVTLGTVGHVDHGKTALVRALTGVETDRLAGKSERGSSIELGYARLTLPSGRRVSLIDVPGHARSVRTMVAGATGIDAFVITIAADDGVMPQTREHAAVLRALDVRHGLVVVTKADVADPGRALAEAAVLLPGVPAVAASARTGGGVYAVREALDQVVAGLPGRAAADGPARLHIDRAFTINKAGTVVTGTLWSGEIVRGEELVLVPRGIRVRVRGVQVHDEPCDRAQARQRLAVELAGLAVREVAPGDVLVGSGAGSGSGSAAASGSGAGSGSAAGYGPAAGYASAAGYGSTAGYGSAAGYGSEPVVWATHVIDAALEFGERREREPEHGARVAVHHGTRESPARLHRLGGRFWQIRLERALIVAPGDRLVIRRLAAPDTIGGGLVLDPTARRHPTSNDVIVRLTRLLRGDPPLPPEPPRPGRPAPAPVAEPPPLSPGAVALEARLRESWFEPASDLPAAELAELRRAGRAVRVGPTLHYHPDALDEVERRVAALISPDRQITLGRLRDELAISRRLARALLEHLDARS